MKLSIAPEAEAELTEAILWYDQRELGLGSNLEAAVNCKLLAIVANPNHFGKYEGGGVKSPYQRALVERFPYVIVFETTIDEIIVHSITHTAREPGHWERR